MGFIATLKNIFTRNAPQNETLLSNPNSWFTDLFMPKTKSGAVVNDASVLGITAVWRSLHILGETIASLPFEVYRSDDAGNVQVDSRNTAHRLVSSEPSRLYTSFTFRETMMYHLGVRGNFYARIYRNGNGRPIELEILNPDAVRILQKDRRLYYQLSEKVILQDYEVLHVPAFAFDGVMGKNPIEAHRESLGVAIANTGYAGELYGNGAQLSGVLSTDLSLTKDQIERLKASWSRNYEGSGNKGKTAILEGGMKYQPIGLTPVDAQYIETAKLSVEDIARIYGIPMHMLSALDRATFNNIEQLSLDFVRNTIRPWCKRIEEEFTRKLIMEGDKGRVYCRFNLDGLLRGDTAARAQFYQTMFQVGAFSQNDIRRLENMNTIPEGNTYWVPLNMVDSAAERDSAGALMQDDSPEPSPQPQKENNASTDRKEENEN